MGYLQSFARDKKQRRKKKQFPVRLPENLYTEFKTYCDNLGLTINEAIHLLIQQELEQSNDQKFKKSDITNQSTYSIQKKSPSSPKNKKGNRFSTAPWSVESQLPCPLCREWKSKSNFNRHTQTHHQLSSQEILEKYSDIAKEMIKKNTTN